MTGTKMDEDFVNHKNKIVLVTGASGQIGSDICKTYLSHGAIVIGLDLQQPIDTLKLYEKFHHQALDVTNSDEVNLAFASLAKEFGSLDVLVNNAGVASFESFWDRTDQELTTMVDVNLKGTFHCIRAFIKNSNTTNSNRSIVNVGSIYGIVSPDFRVYRDGDRRSPEMYGATKAGVIQMSRYFAVALSKDGIRVNSVSPGGIYNPDNPQSENFVREYSARVPLARMGNSHEIANAIIYLTSESASYITGHNLVVDGGYSAI
jgi:NAD(P)-dependent dehydrogenase (short-subunit alcohol dehydrogenase family)